MIPVHRWLDDRLGGDPLSRLHVFVPSMLGAGLLVSLALLVTDLASRLSGGGGARRRRTILSKSVAFDVARRGGTRVPDPARVGLRHPMVYVVVGLLAASLAGYGLVGGTWNYWNPTERLRNLAWLWAGSLVVTVLAARLAWACAAAARRPPRPLSSVRPLVVQSPLGRASPGDSDGTPGPGS